MMDKEVVEERAELTITELEDVKVRVDILEVENKSLEVTCVM